MNPQAALAASPVRPPAASPAFADHLRRQSQLELALAAGLSQRHLSFLESGRARPSRAMLLRLAEALALELAQRNDWLIAAGFAPIYPQRPIDAGDMAPVREALARMLAHHEPFPALVIDRAWNLVMANAATTTLFTASARLLGHADLDALWAATCPDGVRNIVRLTLHPQGLRPLIDNAEELVAALLARLAHEAVDHAPSARLREAVLALDGIAEIARRAARDADLGARLTPVLATRYRVGPARIALFAMLSRFDLPRDLTAEDLRVETLYPADAESEAVLRALAAGG